MHIRFAQSQDFDFIIQGLENNRRIEERPLNQISATETDKQEFHDAIKNQNIRIMEDETNPVGFLHFKIDAAVMYVEKRFFWIDLIYVDEKFRERGIGKLLYQDAIDIAKQNGLDTIVLDIFDANIRSKTFHEKLGFKPLYTIYTKEL